VVRLPRLDDAVDRSGPGGGFPAGMPRMVPSIVAARRPCYRAARMPKKSIEDVDRVIQRALSDKQAAVDAACKAFMDGTDEDSIEAARKAGVAAKRAARAAFGDDEGARLADARERARTAACAARMVTEVLKRSGIPIDMEADARRAEQAASGNSADDILEAAVSCDLSVHVFESGHRDDVKAALATCHKHRHVTDPTANPADAAYAILLSAHGTAEMAAHGGSDHLSDVRKCSGKTRHETEAEARAAAERRSRESGVRLRVYKCGITGCGGWHLTSKTNEP
jgi:hypothetical protein